MKTQELYKPTAPKSPIKETYAEIAKTRKMVKRMNLRNSKK